MDLQGPPLHSNNGPGPSQSASASQYRPPASSQLFSSLAEQSRLSDGNSVKTEELAAMISADVKHHSNYVIKRAEPGPPPSQEASASQSQRSQVAYGMEGLEENLNEGSQAVNQEEEEEVVAKEDIVQAWRFGSTWVPMEKDTFEPLQTQQGVEVLGFFPRENVSLNFL